MRSKEFDISGEIDLLADNDIYEFKCNGSTYRNQRVQYDTLLSVLGYAAILRMNNPGQSYDKLYIYDVMQGVLIYIDIGGWDKHE